MLRGNRVFRQDDDVADRLLWTVFSLMPGPDDAVTVIDDIRAERLDQFSFVSRTASPVRAWPLPLGRPRTSVAHLPICAAHGNSIPVQVTIGSTLVADVPFTGVRLILANYSESQQVFSSMRVAASATAASPIHAVDAAGSPSAWLPVTIDGQVPCIPAGTAYRPAIAVTDLVPIESVSRTDGGTGCLIFTRAAGPSGGTNHFNQMATITTTSAFSENTPGRPVSCWYVGGDHASDPATIDADGVHPNLDTPFFFVAGAIFFNETRCITMMGVGDSLTQGLMADAGYSGFARHAASLLGTPSLGVSYVDAGYSGQTTAQFTTRAADLIRAGVPVDVLTVPIDSPNDYAAGIGRIQQEATILAFVDFALSRNIAVILVTSIPCNAAAGDISHGLDRVASSTKLRRRLQPGIMLLDAQTIISGYVPTESRLPAAPESLLGEDGVHLNATAQARLGAALAEMLAPLLEPMMAAA